MVNLSFDIESREYQGRYYTDIRGWKAEKIDANATAAAAPAPAASDAPAAAPAPPAPAADMSFEQTPQDDLPF